MTAEPSLLSLEAAWRARWEEALAVWSRYTRLSPPRFCFSADEEEAEDLVGSFAMIRLVDQTIVLSARQIAARGIAAFPREVLAHEIGHHVLCPGDLTDLGRMLARMRAALPSKEAQAPLVANLYGDLLINDRLQRSAGLDVIGVYRALGAPGARDKVSNLYMRIYEVLWNLPRGALAPAAEPAMDGDARLGARVVRAYGKRWLDGAGRFAALCLPYLMEEEEKASHGVWRDTEHAGRGGDPAGLAAIEDDEESGAIHPALDDELTGFDTDKGRQGRTGENPHGRGGEKKVDRYRGVIEYGELLESLGVAIDETQAAVRYYRERAMPHVIRFPTRIAPRVTEPEAEGVETWDVGSPLERVDWVQSLLRGPQIIPGLTTVERVYGESRGHQSKREPLDLYIGIDCSGSMPNPTRQLSYPVLAGAILALSALRAGARVKVVLSGEPGRTVSTAGFEKDERTVLRTLTRYLGCGYAFGIRRLADTFEGRRPDERPVHLVVITDQDIFSLLDDAKTEPPGWEVARRALASARGGGTYVRHMPPGWQDANVQRLEKDGFHVHRVYDWVELVDFARSFGRLTYEDKR